MTSPKLYWFNTWEDIKEPIDHIYQRYCCDAETGKKTRNIYAYSLSLGGGILANYLTKVGTHTPLSAAVIYVMPFNLRDNIPFFRRNFFKFYDTVMGYNFHCLLKSKFSDFKKVMTEEQFNTYVQRVMANKSSLMDIDVNVMIASFDEYKDNLELYYEENQMMGQIHKVKIPTFFLSCRDDPCIRPDLYPFKEFESNEHVIAGFTQRGGHCGSFTGGLKPVQWYP